MQNNISPKQDEDFLKVQDLLLLCLARWRWFVFSLMLIIGAAILYLLVMPPVYTRSAAILIKEDSQGKSLPGELNSFADMGLFQTNTNVNNELLSLQSPSLILEVVKRLSLDVNYFTDGRFHREILYGQSLPALVSFHELTDNESCSLTMNRLADGRIQLSDFVLNGESTDDNKTAPDIPATPSVPRSAK